MLYFITFIATLLGGLTQSITGFGSGIVIMLILPLVYSITKSGILNVMVAMVLNISLVVKFWKDINFRLVILPVIIDIITCTYAVYLSTILDTQTLKLIFSLFLIALAIYFIAFSDRIKVKGNFMTIAICSGLGGLANGMFGIGGPPMALLFLSITSSKKEYVATTQMYFLLTSFYTIIARLFNGTVTLDIAVLLMPGIIGILLGKTIGLKFVDKISHDALKKIVYFFLLFSGVMTFIQCL